LKQAALRCGDEGGCRAFHKSTALITTTSLIGSQIFVTSLAVMSVAVKKRASDI
jgi:hypothetical protein